MAMTLVGRSGLTAHWKTHGSRGGRLPAGVGSHPRLGANVSIQAGFPIKLAVKNQVALGFGEGLAKEGGDRCRRTQQIKRAAERRHTTMTTLSAKDA